MIKKSILSLLIVFLLVFSILPMGVFGENVDEDGDLLFQCARDGKVSLTGLEPVRSTLEEAFFKVLDEQSDKLPVFLAVLFNVEQGAKRLVLGGQIVDGLLDLTLLSLGESDNTNAQLLLLFQKSAHHMSNIIGFAAIALAAIGTVSQLVIADGALQQGFGPLQAVFRFGNFDGRSDLQFTNTWNGQQLALIKRLRAKTNETFML